MDDNLVIKTELALIKIAKTNLQEEIISKFPHDKIPTDNLIRSIKRFAAEKLETFDLDRDDKNTILGNIILEDLDDLIPTVH